MVEAREKYILDANVLMAAARLYYAFDLAPSFWKALDEKIKVGDIILLDMVMGEIEKGQDELKAWVTKRKGEFELCKHVDAEIISIYAKIMQYVQECGFYNEKGLNEWAKNDVADPWLIAAAAAKGYVVVTFEQSVGLLSKKNKTGKVRIPDVADYFDVKVYNLYQMMRKLAIKM